MDENLCQPVSEGRSRAVVGVDDLPKEEVQHRCLLLS